jgi:hypothetical protein
MQQVAARSDRCFFFSVSICLGPSALKADTFQTCSVAKRANMRNTPGKKVIVKVGGIVEEPRVACRLSRSVYYQRYQKLSR